MIPKDKNILYNFIFLICIYILFQKKKGIIYLKHNLENKGNIYFLVNLLFIKYIYLFFKFYILKCYLNLIIYSKYGDKIIIPYIIFFNSFKSFNSFCSDFKKCFIILKFRIILI